MKTKNILFVCKHNIFRSRTAETYFKQINKNKNIKATSAGIFIGAKQSSNQLKAVKEEKVTPISKPKAMSTDLLRKQDLIIIVANDIPKSIFNNKDYAKNVILWKIPDVLNDNKKECHKTIQLIKKRVEKLIEDLK